MLWKSRGLECFVHLEGPLSTAIRSLKAYGLKWQWGPGDAKAIISQSCTPAGGTRSAIEEKGGEATGGQWLSHRFTAHTHMPTAEYTAEWDFSHGNISDSWNRVGAYVHTSLPLCLTLGKCKVWTRCAPSGLVAIMTGGLNMRCEFLCYRIIYSQSVWQLFLSFQTRLTVAFALKCSKKICNIAQKRKKKVYLLLLICSILFWCRHFLRRCFVVIVCVNTHLQHFFFF